MSEKTAELKEQIKIMNYNYQALKEMHERGYQYSVGEIKRLQDELERTHKALDIAVKTLERLDKELYLNNAKQTAHVTDSVAQIPGIALDQIKQTVGE